MIEEKASVVALDGNWAWVKTSRQSACGRCAVNSGCGIGMLDKVLGRRTAMLKVMNPKGVSVGDRVFVGIHEDAMIKGSLFVYIVPLLGLLGGAFIGEMWLSRVAPEFGAIITGMLGFLVGYGWAKWMTRRLSDEACFQAVILRHV